MALVFANDRQHPPHGDRARGRIADTGEDTFTSSMHHDYILADEQYILAGEQGHEILYLLQGDSGYIDAHQSDSVEVRLRW